MSDSMTPIMAHVPAFLMVLFRLGGIFIFAPMFGSSVIPMRIKTLLVLVLAVCLYPAVPAQVPLALNINTLALAVGTELLIGLVIGYGASLPLVAMQIGGQMMGHQLGLGLAQVLNPEFNEQTEVLSQLLFMMALAIFLTLGGHLAMVGALTHSFQAVPLGGFRPGPHMVELAIGLLSSMMSLGVRVAAPLLCIVFLETIALGFVARTVPQLNILSLGFPMRILVGMFILIGIISAIGFALGSEIDHSLTFIFQWIGVL